MKTGRGGVYGAVVSHVLDGGEYEHRKGYEIMLEVCVTTLNQTNPSPVPTYAPSICLACLTIHEDKVMGGKLWRGCTYCLPTVRKGLRTGTELLTPEQLTLHSDLYALLSPYIPQHQIDTLLCLHYGGKQNTKNLNQSPNSRIIQYRTEGTANTKEPSQ